ncbi:hypothetical protein ABID19_001847 [Mesorhizobium robiniae]|uniref:Uncharacterized protein n=1 Tax=Mesorhizobium robiniae TaxID=559315 RepID=A0ABV2GKW8_9HYPH
MARVSARVTRAIDKRILRAVRPLRLGQVRSARCQELAVTGF